MDPDPLDVRYPVDAVALFWLRLTLFVALFISALGALISFRCLLIYGGAVTGRFQLVEGTPEYELFQIIQRNPAPRLTLEGFNLFLWVGVLIGAIHLLRLREWARVFIKTLITIDLFVTLGVAFWPAIAHRIYNRPIQTDVTVDVVITTLEVLIVVVLSHPRVVSLTDVHRGHRGEIRRMTSVRERRPNGSE